MFQKDDESKQEEDQRPTEELVSLGRVAMAEQNYSLAADFLSAALAKQVFFGPCP